MYQIITTTLDKNLHPQIFLRQCPLCVGLQNGVLLNNALRFLKAHLSN